jgi:tRNA threonylcarbamoyl adenosine modification protein YjeE
MSVADRQHLAPALAAISVTVDSEAGTRALAAALARQCRPGDCIALGGDLGAGKTAFARGFIQALQATHDEVVSPTFTLVQSYPAADGFLLWHFDLYRLRNPAELDEIGLDEALQTGITLIEWPELARHALPAEALDVTITPGKTPGGRVFEFAGTPAAWQDRLQALKGMTP